MNAMLFELQNKVRIRKATGAPMLLRDDLARLRCEFTPDFAAPRPGLESLARPSRLLDGRNVFPTLVVTWAVPMMQRIKNAKLRLPRSVQDLQHVWNTAV